jgi:hypothetical protein
MNPGNSSYEGTLRRFVCRSKCAGLAGLLLLSGVVSVAGCRQVPESQFEAAWTPPALDADDVIPTDGRAVIQRLLEFMRSHQELVTEAFVTYQAVQESGQKLHFDLLQKIALRKPDKLYWQTLRDDASVDTAWFSDGVFRILKQPANHWGEIEAPATITELVKVLDEEYRMPVPFHDILAGDPGRLWLGEEVTSAKGPEPFLAKMAIVFTEAEGQPTYSARFRKWATSIPETTEFAFNPPPDSEQIEVVPVNQR